MRAAIIIHLVYRAQIKASDFAAVRLIKYSCQQMTTHYTSLSRGHKDIQTGNVIGGRYTMTLRNMSTHMATQKMVDERSTRPIVSAWSDPV